MEGRPFSNSQRNEFAMSSETGLAIFGFCRVDAATSCLEMLFEQCSVDRKLDRSIFQSREQKRVRQFERIKTFPGRRNQRRSIQDGRRRNSQGFHCVAGHVLRSEFVFPKYAGAEKRPGSVRENSLIGTSFRVKRNDHFRSRLCLVRQPLRVGWYPAPPRWKR